MPSPFPYPILYRSPRLVVIDKPAGLPVHPGPRTERSVETLFPLLSRRKDGPWLAHRLDTDTSGCLMIALRKQALIEAQALFATGKIRKIYRAVVENAPAAESGLIDRPIRKVSTSQGWHMESHEAGQPARTSWRVLSRGKKHALLELGLLTGRTHQARLHCALLGCPILGDARYGAIPGPLHLVSWRLDAELSTETISAQAEIPPHMQQSCQDFGLVLP